ncbi:MAG: thioredoxin [Patescibacteria group bacterium]|nr:thioredoxin [Patescibacteria group bacterium]
MSKVLNLDGEQQFAEEVRKSDLPVLVDFWAPWCMPCKMMAPTLDELSEKMDGKIKVAKVDTQNQENAKLAMEFNIQSIPNMKLFKGGEVIGEFVGLRDFNTLKGEIEEIINK